MSSFAVTDSRLRGLHGLFSGDANRGAERQARPAARHVRLFVEGSEHLGRGEAGGVGGPEPGGSAQLHAPGPGPAAAGGEGGEPGGDRGKRGTGAGGE